MGGGWGGIKVREWSVCPRPSAARWLRYRRPCTVGRLYTVGKLYTGGQLYNAVDTPHAVGIGGG